MKIEELETLIQLLKKFIQTDGDLADKRVEKTLQLIKGTVEDSK